jgi:hypothetical protein
MIEFRGPAKRLDDIDLPRIGHEIGVGEDEIHAVLTVESSGSGFDAKGRPKMLFEPHVFYRNLSGANRDRAVREGIAYAAWKPGAYPSDSYPRLVAAINIDETAALKSASWGLGQILGENYKAAGYATPQEMVKACVDDEENHLAMMVRFIKANRLDDDLRRHDWAGFARGYNGAQYAKNNYDGRLAAAFKKWQGIKDTPFTVDDFRRRASDEGHAAAVPPPPDIPKAEPKPPAVAKTGSNVGGLIGGAVVTGSTVVIAKQTSAQGASTSQIALVVGCGLVIALAVFFVIRHWRKP